MACLDEQGLTAVGITRLLAHQIFHDLDKDDCGELSPTVLLTASLLDYAKNIMIVSTVPGGFNSGRRYAFEQVHTIPSSVHTEQDGSHTHALDTWIENVREASARAMARHKTLRAWLGFQVLASSLWLLLTSCH